MWVAYSVASLPRRMRFPDVWTAEREHHGVLFFLGRELSGEVVNCLLLGDQQGQVRDVLGDQKGQVRDVL